MRNHKYGVISIIASGILLSACAPDVAFQTVSQELASSNGDGVTYKSVSQSFDVKANTDVDVLFVVDNSGSMDAEQKGIASKINGFMDIIKDANWHVALTTTDPKVNTIGPDKVSRAWGDGQFRPFDSDTGSLYVLKAGQNSLADAQKMLASAVQVGLLGDGSERSINASYRAIERTADTPANQTFFREKSKLIVIAISDEDECSDGKCTSAAEKSVPANLVKLVHDRFGSDKVFMFNSIVKAPSDTGCTTAAAAPIYEAMSKLTGGLIGSVCATDYTATLTKMGYKTVELLRSINLNCKPADANGDGDLDFALLDSKGNKIAAGYSISGTTVTFASSLPEGSYSASYSCAESSK